ncbi:MAG: hypothetical protein IPP93_18175 [Chitinophagaceae bacterium]|nr:hypothetical protein [Chitinophagaceae bacterium]
MKVARKKPLRAPLHRERREKQTRHERREKHLATRNSSICMYSPLRRERCEKQSAASNTILSVLTSSRPPRWLYSFHLCATRTNNNWYGNKHGNTDG